MARQRVAVVDYGMGNPALGCQGLAACRARRGRAGHRRRDVIAGADRVRLPRVGAIRDCMVELARRGLTGAIRQAADEKPLLAICIGMQALMQSSEENGGTACLGILPGRVRPFRHRARGRRRQHAEGAAHGLEPGAPGIPPAVDRHPAAQPLYFVHSYYVEPAQRELVAGSCEYGVGFAAALARGTCSRAVPPEKSHTAGLQAASRNFVAWNGRALECAC